MSKLTWDSGANAKVLRFPAKKLRAEVIADYVRAAGYPGVVVFTCGNAADALRTCSPLHSVLEVGPRGALNTNKWWKPAEIHAAWPDRFDATSGHLSLPLMIRIGQRFRDYFFDMEYPPEYTFGGPNNPHYFVPTGSGETIVCLRLAFPTVPFCAVYDNSCVSTTRDPDAPLNSLVDAWFPVVHWNGTLVVADGTLAN